MLLRLFFIALNFGWKYATGSRDGGVLASDQIKHLLHQAKHGVQQVRQAKGRIGSYFEQRRAKSVVATVVPNPTAAQ